MNDSIEKSFIVPTVKWKLIMQNVKPMKMFIISAQILKKGCLPMKLKRVWLMSGLPGSGKSTWIKNKIAEKGGFWASRDAMRFSMVREDEPYFERETEVFNAWIAQICDALNNPLIEDIYIDATHLNDRSREKTLSRLPKDNIQKITNVVFKVPIETCLERNALRSGREVVPESAIRNMKKSFKMPKNYSTIIVDAEGREIV